MFKKFIPAILGLSILLTANMPAMAAQSDVKVGKNDITIEKTFTSNSADAKFEFDEEIKQDGKKYKFKGASYDIVSQEALTENQIKTETVDYKNLYQKEDVNAEDTITVNQDGKEITLNFKDVTYSDTVIENRTAKVTAYTDYDFKTVKPTPNQTKTVSYYDKATGQTVTRDLALKELKVKSDWAWRPDLTIPITFSFYDSEYYKLGDKYIPYNDKTPALNGYENDLLKELKLDPYKYRITSVEWDGAAFKSGDVLYRKAIAKGERYTANYVAYYESNINLPNANGYNAVANYETQITVPTGSVEYTIKATAVYTPDNTTAIIVASVAGGIILIVLLVVAILYVLSKKQKKRGELNE